MCPLLYPKNTQAYLWNLFKSEDIKDRLCPEVSVALLLFLSIFYHWASKCQHDESIYSCSHCTPPFSGCARITSCRLKLLPISYSEFSSKFFITFIISFVASSLYHVTHFHCFWTMYLYPGNQCTDNWHFTCTVTAQWLCVTKAKPHLLQSKVTKLRVTRQLSPRWWHSFWPVPLNCCIIWAFTKRKVVPKSPELIQRQQSSFHPVGQTQPISRDKASSGIEGPGFPLL